MSEQLQEAIHRVMRGSRDEADIQAIVAALETRQLSLVTGSGSIGVSGDATNAIFNTGSNNTNIILRGEVAESLQAILEQFNLNSLKASASIDELVQQTRLHCCSKIVNLYSKIQLLNRKSVDVDQFYVDVYLLEKPSNETFATIPGLLEGSDLRDSDRFGLGNRGARQPGVEAVTQHPRLMIFGKPGSGKSTFLKHLAVVCAKGEILSDYIPVLLELRFVRKLNQFDLWEILRREFRLKERAQVEQILDQSPIFLLLDGLDEIPTATHVALQDQILEFSRHHYNSRCILTCRTQTTEYVLPGFEAVEVADYDRQQVDKFAEHWFSSISSSSEEAIELKNRFLLELRANQPVANLAVAPILLSLTCWVFGDLKDFPSSRSVLYEEATNLLLKEWDERRGIHRQGNSKIYRQLPLNKRRQLLSFVAMQKFERKRFILFEQTELVGYIADYLEISR